MRVRGDWLDHPGTKAVMAMLMQAGHQALFVGGCVRNALLSRPVGDIDITTDARPAEVMALAQGAGLRALPTGLDHGTVTVIAHHLPHEVTTLRRDVQTDGRHAQVVFTTDVAQDAARRDFTMNALYARADGTVVDPLGGMADLRAGHVRFIGDAARRIAEDYLRILRFFRFTAIYGDAGLGPDAEGLAACAAMADGLDQLSGERVGAEMRKLLSAPDPAPAVAAMAQAGVLARVLPGADATALGPLVHLEGGCPPDALRRLAALGGQDVAHALRLSRAEARDLAALRHALGQMDTPAAQGWRLGAARGADAVLLRAALLGQPLAADAMADVARGAAARFPITAADLPHLAGPALGAQLKTLESRWLLSDLRLTKADLLG